jgi:hypothetical protein
MKKLLLSLGILSLSTIGLFVQCSEETDTLPKFSVQNNVADIQSTPNFSWKPASTEAAFFQLIRDPRVNIIRSTDDFIQRTKQKGSVYAKLDAQTIKGFIGELKFKNRALSSARYDIIKASLTEVEYAAFWRDFGLDLGFLADHEEYQCVGVGNCKSAGGYICTSNC